MLKANSSPARITAETIRKKLRPRNSWPKSIASPLAFTAWLRTGWKNSPIWPGLISASNRRRTSPSADGVSGYRTAVSVPNRLAHMSRPAASETSAFGVPRKSRQYCSSSSWIRVVSIGTPGRHVVHFWVSAKLGNRGIRSGSAEAFVSGMIFRTRKVRLFSTNVRIGPRT